MHYRVITQAILLLALTVLMGCTYVGGGGTSVDKEVKEVKDAKSSFVFGYVDMADADVPMDWALLKEVGHNQRKEPDHWMRVQDGAFYLENVQAGSYILSEFGGRHWSMFCANTLVCSEPIEYDPGTSMRLVVKKPGIYYLGAFKYKEAKTGFFEQDKFDLKSIDKPTPAEVVQKVLPATKGTRWHDLLVRSSFAKGITLKGGKQ
ncbi:MAG TPA: hypothetical protein VKB51_03995 [bacterium]|nr:hypothetical protein [bacterium]